MIPPRVALIAVCVALVALLGELLYQRYQWHDITPAVRDSLTVLRADKHHDSVAHAQQIVAAESLSHVVAVRVDTVRIIEQHARASDDHARLDAEQARVSRTAADSAKFYHLAFLDEQLRGDSLVVALHKAQDNTRDALASAARFKLADSVSSTRLQRVEALNVSLAAEIARASGGCHVLPFVACPSRVQSIVGAALVSYVVTRQLSGRPLL